MAGLPGQLGLSNDKESLTDEEVDAIFNGDSATETAEPVSPSDVEAEEGSFLPEETFASADDEQLEADRLLREALALLRAHILLSRGISGGASFPVAAAHSEAALTAP